MKIEHLSFDNLNALAGHFEVDFTHPSLSDGGIFVITGPTGSGKTTILDAIAYALYGRSPRQKKVTANENNLMTHGAWECSASVRFEQNGRRFLATASHKRARGAKPYAPPVRTLEELTPDGSSKLLSNKISDVDALVKQFTGLSFENFTRCMLLAQGRFARFLEAGENERAEALATITGTEIYQRIGEEVHRHIQQADAEISALRPAEIMSAEARLLMEQRLECAEAETAAWENKARSQESALLWLRRHAEACEKEAQARLAYEKAEAELAAFTEEGNAARLKLAAAAEKAAPSARDTDHAEAALSDTQSRIAAIEKERERFKPVLLQARLLAQAAISGLQEREPKLTARLEELRTKMRPLEAAAAQARQQAVHSAGVAEQKRQELAAIKKKLSQCEIDCKTAADALTNIQKELSEHESDASLPEMISEIRARLHDWEQQDDGTPLPPLRDIEQALMSNLAAVKGENPEKLRMRLHSLRRLALAETERKRAIDNKIQVETSFQQSLKALHSSPQLESAEELAAAKRKYYDLLLQSSRIEDKLASLYEEFKAGKLSCCPCCGSLVPGERHPLTETGLQEAKRQAEEAESSLRKLRQYRSQAEKKLSKNEADMQTAKALLHEKQETVRAMLQELSLDVFPNDLDGQIAALQQRDRELDELQKIGSRLQQQKRRAELRRLFHLALGHMAEHPASLPAARLAVERLSRRAEAWKEAEKAFSQAQKDLLMTEVRMKELRKQASEHQASTEQADRAAAQCREKEHEAFQLLQARWGTLPSSQQEMELEQTLSDLRLQAEKARNALLRHEEAERGRANSLKTLDSLHKSQRQDLIQAISRFHETLEKLGFSDRNAYEAAAQGIPDLPRLNRQLGRLTEALSNANVLLRREREALAALEATRLAPPGRTEEDMQQELDGQKAVLEQKRALSDALRAQILADDQKRHDNERLENRLAPLREERDRWLLLKETLGGTIDSFREFAQRITFEQLISKANRQLRQINRRYALMPDQTQNLGLRIADLWQDDENGRPCSNLSGGESFMVSLALALGLSHMAGDIRIDTLFLDEGFGTLDRKSTEQVLQCLQNLHANGKIVGVISHVEQLRERIPCHIEVERIGNSGFSSLRACPAVIARPQCPSPPGKRGLPA